MPRKQRLTWTVVLRLAVVVTGFASLVVLGGGTALWLVEGERRDSTIHSWGDLGPGLPSREAARRSGWRTPSPTMARARKTKPEPSVQGARLRHDGSCRMRRDRTMSAAGSRGRRSFPRRCDRPGRR
jgi:hypothetical protein